MRTPGIRARLTGGAAPVALIVAVLAAWEGLVVLLGVPQFILPRPSAVAAGALSGEYNIFLPHVVATLVPILLGFTIGCGLGIAVAVVLDLSTLMRRTLYPLIIATQTTPKIAIAPLLLVWFGTGLAPKVIIVALLAFFPVLINVVAGLGSTDKQLLVLADSVDASPAQIYWTIKLPSAVPNFFAGLKLAMTVSVIGAIVAEWVASNEGLGYLLVYYNSTLDTTSLFAVLVLLVILASALFGLIGLFERFTSWEARSRRGAAGSTKDAFAAQAGAT